MKEKMEKNLLPKKTAVLEDEEVMKVQAKNQLILEEEKDLIEILVTNQKVLQTEKVVVLVEKDN